MSSTARHTRILLIGASRGLGHAITAEYLSRGAHVVATARGNGGTPLDELRGTVGSRLKVEQVDIDEPDQVEALGGRFGGRTFDMLFVTTGVTHRI